MLAGLLIAALLTLAVYHTVAQSPTTDATGDAASGGQLILQAYTVPAASLADTVAKLQVQYAGNANVRVAPDARTSQVLVFAPTDIHGQISKLLAVVPVAPSVAPAVTSPLQSAAASAPANVIASRTFTLRQADWREFEAALREASGRQPSSTQRNGEVAVYNIDVRGGAVTVAIDRVAGAVTLEGPSKLLEPWQKLMESLDNKQANADRSTRIVTLRKTGAGPMNKLVAAVQNGDALAVRTGQAAIAAGASDAKAPAMDRGAPSVEKTLALLQAAGENAGGAGPVAVAEEEGAMIGPVQIEYLEAYDVLIIRGHKQDVERVQKLIAEIESISAQTKPIIEIYPLRNINNEQAATLVTRMYEQILSTRQGRVSITPLVKPNALLLIGRDDGIKAVIELVQRIDVPQSASTQSQVFQLKSATASSIQGTIQEFFVDRGGLSPRVQVTADPRTNSLLVQAAPRDMQEVELLIKRLDTTTSAAENELRVFKLVNSNSDDQAVLLQSAISGQQGAATARRTGNQQQNQQQNVPGAPAPQQFNPQALAGAVGGTSAAAQSKNPMLRLITIDNRGQKVLKSGILSDVRITSDPRANALLVSAPAESMDLIAALIKQLDQLPSAEAQIKVFTIVNGDAGSLVQMLQNLFGRSGGGQQANQANINPFGAFGGGANIAQVQSASVQGESTIVPLRFSTDTRTNSIVASGTTGDLSVVEAILLRLDDSDVRQRKSIVYRLKNAPANDVAQAINAFLTSERQVNQLSPGLTSPFEQLEREVVVVPEIVSNALIVSATARYFDEIKKIVEQLDERPPMVMIQVLIAQVQLSNNDEFGIELGLQDSVLFDRSLLGNLVTQTTTTTFGNPATTTQSQNIVGATNTPGFNFNNGDPLGNSGSTQAISTAPSTGGQGITNFGVGRTNGTLGFGGLVLSASSENISFLLRALNENRRIDVLSRPQIMTLDNQPAYIQVGQRVPRINSTSTNTNGQTINSVTLDNVGLILGVTPRISPEGLVVMEIDAEKSAVGPEAEGIPISVSANGAVIRSPRIDTTVAQTTVSALSGQTIVLGGLITKSKTGVHRRVPVLSEIPLLGNLFRYDNVVNQRDELLIIMTPRIVRTEQDAELVKQVEASRMNWCLADVIKLHGPSGLRGRNADWTDAETPVIYPDLDPTGRIVVPELILGEPDKDPKDRPRTDGTHSAESLPLPPTPKPQVVRPRIDPSQPQLIIPDGMPTPARPLVTPPRPLTPASTPAFNQDSRQPTPARMPANAASAPAAPDRGPDLPQQASRGGYDPRYSAATQQYSAQPPAANAQAWPTQPAQSAYVQPASAQQPAGGYQAVYQGGYQQPYAPPAAAQATPGNQRAPQQSPPAQAIPSQFSAGGYVAPGTWHDSDMEPRR